MNIPFKLNIFKQIEIYQELRELDHQFNMQLKKCKGKILGCKNPPLWFFVKKILYWSYLEHKHLGSPITFFSWLEVSYIKLHCTSEEFTTVQIRKVYGWMEACGLAKFFKNEKNNYDKINQENCDGIFLTQKGLEYAKGVYYWYKLEKAKDKYKKIKGVEEVLRLDWTKFSLYAFISALIIIGSIFLFLLQLSNAIINLFYGS